MYLFGSIHVASPGLYPLPDFVMDAFHRSDYLAVEVDLLADTGSAVALMLPFMYIDGRSAIDDMGEELHGQARAFLTESGMLLPLDTFKPIMWYSALTGAVSEQAGFSLEYGLDMFFLREAQRRGMEVLEVESMQIQMDMMAGFSMPLQVALVASIVEDIDRSVQEVQELYSLWKQGDEQTITAMFNRDYIYDDELFAEYWDALLTQRDIRMTEIARSYMADGRNVFFVVGLAHFVVENGIIDLLVQYGYDVVRVQ